MHICGMSADVHGSFALDSTLRTVALFAKPSNVLSKWLDETLLSDGYGIWPVESRNIVLFGYISPRRVRPMSRTDARR